MQNVLSLLWVVSISSTTLFSAEMSENKLHCGFCGKKFGQNCHRKRHELIHTKTYPFECILCGHKIRQKSNMETHVGTHTNDKLCPCPCPCPWGCGYSFANGYKYKRLNDHQTLFSEEDHVSKVRAAVQSNKDCLWISKLPKRQKKRNSCKRKRDRPGRFSPSKEPRIFYHLYSVLLPNNITILTAESSASSSEVAGSSKVNRTPTEAYVSSKSTGKLEEGELSSNYDPFANYQ